MGLSNDKVTIQVQALKGDAAPPAMILLPEQMRRLNDMGALMEQRLPGLPDHHVLLVNRRHPLVEGLLKLKSGSVLVDSAESSPTERLSRDLAGFQTRSATLMGDLMQRGL